MPKITIGEKEFFLSKCVKRSDGCWEWLGSRNNQGYGWFKYGCTRRLAHRASIEIFLERDIAGCQVKHLCPHRWCVNPAHLEVHYFSTTDKQLVAEFYQLKESDADEYADFLEWRRLRKARQSQVKQSGPIRPNL